MKSINIEKEYSERFDKLSKDRVITSYYKYGSAAINFTQGYVNALGSLDKCIKKYKETGNTEYLIDAKNYLMFEFMYPSIKGAYFKETDSNGSAGIDGMSIKEVEDFRNENMD